MDKYLVLLNTQQVRAIMPVDHNIFKIIHFEKLSQDLYLLCYQGSREMTIVKQNEIEVLLDQNLNEDL
jgi:hypothetical protein